MAGPTSTGLPGDSSWVGRQLSRVHEREHELPGIVAILWASTTRVQIAPGQQNRRHHERRRSIYARRCLDRATTITPLLHEGSRKTCSAHEARGLETASRVSDTNPTQGYEPQTGTSGARRRDTTPRLHEVQFGAGRLDQWSLGKYVLLVHERINGRSHHTSRCSCW